LYEAFYKDTARFEELYVKYEKRKDLRTKTMSAEEVFKSGILKERTDTGRIYLVFIDNVMSQGPFDPEYHTIYQSNLCCEILLPTKSFKRLDDSDGRIALCTLGSINWGAFRNPEDMRRACRILHRSLNNILDYQDFLSIQSKLSNDEIRPLGIGITNLAYWHAKRGLKYGEKDALAEVKTWQEHQSFYLTEMSVELAKERGKCLGSDQTRYGQGVFPWELRAKGVNDLANFAPELDWEPLRADMKQYGVRNATNGAVAPVESSSVVINSTNGIEMPMSLISVKESKAGSFVQVVPEYHKLKNKYQLMWEQKDCEGYIKTAAVIAAYTDQSISTNTFYNPAHFADRKVPTTLIAKNLMQAHMWGLKTFYYSLINKAGSKMKAEEAPAMLEAIDFDNEDDCESCKL
jgi:ribonucleoside-diphosphate reductase alpha chain